MYQERMTSSSRNIHFSKTQSTLHAADAVSYASRRVLEIITSCECVVTLFVSSEGDRMDSHPFTSTLGPTGLGL